MSKAPCPDSTKLDAFLNDGLSSKRRRLVKDHLAACQSCRKQLHQLKDFQGVLLTALSCPDSELLAQWVDGALGLSQARSIQKHLDACDDCQIVVEITSQALDDMESGLFEDQLQQASQQAPSDKRNKTKRRKRRRLSPNSPSPFLTWALPMAAAAALLLLLALSPKSGPSDTNISKKQDPTTKIKNTDIKDKDPQKGPKPEPKPQKGPKPKDNKPKDSANKDPKTSNNDTTNTDPSPTPEQQPDPTKQPDPAPDSKPEHKAKDKDPKTPEDQSNVRAQRSLAIRGAHGALAMKRVGSNNWRALEGSALLNREDQLMAQRGHAEFDFGGVRVSLRKGSVVHLERQDAEESRLAIDEGEAFFDLSKGRAAGFNGRFVAIAGQSQTTALGTRFLVRREGDGAKVYVEEGQVELKSAGDSVKINAGEAYSAKPDKAPKAVSASALRVQAWRQEALSAQVLARGLSYPRAWTAWQVFDKVLADLKSGSERAQARALLALTAAQQHPDCRVLVNAETARLLNEKQQALLQQASRPTQASLLQQQLLKALVVVRERPAALRTLKRKDKALFASIEGLAEALKGAQNLTNEELLALRLATLCGVKDLELARWKQLLKDRALTGELSAEDQLFLNLLPKRLQSKQPIAGALKQAADKWSASWSQATVDLLSLHRAGALAGLALSGAERQQSMTALMRSQAELNAVDRLLIVSEALPRMLSRSALEPQTLGPLVLPRDGQFVVLFRFKGSRKFRSAILCGDWDDWKEAKPSMRKDGRGVFTQQLRLAAKRHEYKFKITSKDWETDRSHGLDVEDGHGGLNSVLDLRPLR